MHQKHTKLTRPNYGNFGRNEWSIIGTPCGEIKKLAFQLTQKLSKNWKIGYVDADHKNEVIENSAQQSAIDFSASLEYTDKISHHRFDTKSELGDFQFRQYFNETDLVLVNGNHFKAKNQIVVIDPKKEDSLKRKLDRLTNVELILLQENVSDVFPFIKEHLSNFEEIPVLKVSDFEAIKNFISDKMKAAIPPLFGLVLAGGKSQRMGQDKGLLNYHGKPQREYAFDLLNEICDKTFLSFREGQTAEKNFPIIKDSFQNLGPFGAIVSAFREFPNHAWLVIACDLPLLDKATLAFLKANRNSSKIATAFHNPDTNFPEPLITIWEPSSYPLLLQFLSQGYSCPRKVLINSEIETVTLPDLQAIKNVNTEEEMEEVKAILS